MDRIERIKRMLEVEKQTIDRQAQEVTVDFPAVRAEIRAECLDQVLQLFEPTP